MPYYYVLSGSVEEASYLGMMGKTRLISCQDLGLSPSDFLEVFLCLSSVQDLMRFRIRPRLS